MNFSPRQKSIIIHIAKGYTVAEYARKFKIGQKTAETHIEIIKGKLGTSNHAILTHIAIERGWVKIMNEDEIKEGLYRENYRGDLPLP